MVTSMMSSLPCFCSTRAATAHLHINWWLVVEPLRFPPSGSLSDKFTFSQTCPVDGRFESTLSQVLEGPLDKSVSIRILGNKGFCQKKCRQSVPLTIKSRPCVDGEFRVHKCLWKFARAFRQRFTFQQDNKTIHTTRAALEPFQSKHLSIGNMWKNLKPDMKIPPPSNLTVSELYCKAE